MKYRDRATEVALFRYALIREPADPALSKAERGRLVRALAGTAHAGPDGEEVRVGRSTLDEWIPGLAGRGLRGAETQAPGTVAQGAGPVVRPGRGAAPGGPRAHRRPYLPDNRHRPRLGAK